MTRGHHSGTSLQWHMCKDQLMRGVSRQRARPQSSCYSLRRQVQPLCVQGTLPREMSQLEGYVTAFGHSGS